MGGVQAALEDFSQDAANRSHHLIGGSGGVLLQQTGIEGLGVLIAQRCLRKGASIHAAATDVIATVSRGPRIVRLDLALSWER
jgi:hypothetical protein